MESRKWKRKTPTYMKMKRLTIFFSLLVAYLGLSLFLKMLPGTFAWLTSSTKANGQIQNATSLDLLTINPEEVQYGRNGRVKSRINIKNISTISIPLKIELLPNNQGIASSTILKPNSTFTTNLIELSFSLKKSDIKHIQYRIVGFNGYIDEIITVPIDQEKLKSTIEKTNEEAVQAVNAVDSKLKTDNEGAPIVVTEEKPQVISNDKNQGQAVNESNTSPEIQQNPSTTTP